MAKKKTKYRKSQKSNAPKKCYFCIEKKEPDFADTTLLGRFVTERAKIIPRSRSGLCAKHQKRLALSVKHARHLALLPFAASV